MRDRPDAAELAEAVREFLESEVLPILTDHRLRFRALVAVNGLGILERDLRAGSGEDEAERQELQRLLGSEEKDLVALNRELAQRIRAGEAPPGTFAVLQRSVRAKLRVASPRTLERYR